MNHLINFSFHFKTTLSHNWLIFFPTNVLQMVVIPNTDKHNFETNLNFFLIDKKIFHTNLNLILGSCWKAWMSSTNRIFWYTITSILPHHWLGSIGAETDYSPLQTSYSPWTGPRALWPSFYQWTCAADPRWPVSYFIL